MTNIEVTGKDKPKKTAKLDPEDELYKKATSLMDMYVAGREMENMGKEQKEKARDDLKAVLGVIALTQGFQPEDLDGMVGETGFLGPNNNGRMVPKQRVFKKTVLNKTRLDEKLLLELGVTPDQIAKATVPAPVESWTVTDINL